MIPLSEHEAQFLKEGSPEKVVHLLDDQFFVKLQLLHPHGMGHLHLERSIPHPDGLGYVGNGFAYKFIPYVEDFLFSDLWPQSGLVQVAA
jgi:hypothetical protein